MLTNIGTNSSYQRGEAHCMHNLLTPLFNFSAPLANGIHNIFKLILMLIPSNIYTNVQKNRNIA